MPDEPQKLDPEETLGDDWGAFKGYKPQDALRIMMGMHTELASENQRLRKAPAPAAAADAPVPNTSPPLSDKQPDWDAIKGDDRDAASKAMAEYTESVVDDLVNKRLAKDRTTSFPTDRDRAKRDGADVVKQLKGDPQDYLKYVESLDKNLTDQRGVSQDAQVDPKVWAQAYIQLKGYEALSGNTVESKTSPAVATTPYVERPSPGVPMSASTVPEGEWEMPEEKRTKREWERTLGTTIPDDEWFAFRDKINNVEDYERWVSDQKRKDDKKGRR